MITALHHVAIIMNNERNLEFYRLLGFAEIFRKVRKYDNAVLMRGHGLELEIFIDPRHAERGSGLDEPFGLRHIALEVTVCSKMRSSV